MSRSRGEFDLRDSDGRKIESVWNTLAIGGNPLRQGFRPTTGINFRQPFAKRLASTIAYCLRTGIDAKAARSKD
jgi:hypothetical protein